jgi:hypothetical protein
MSSNISLELTAIALIIAYFVSTIDVPNTLMVSHFVIMLSACRAPVDVYLVNERERPKAIHKILLLDVIFRPIVLGFNCSVWIVIRQLQRQSNLCAGGAGNWVFFGKVSGITEAIAQSNAAFGFVIMDMVFELLRFAAEGARWVVWKRKGQDTKLFSDAYKCDARSWWVVWICGKLFGRTPSSVKVVLGVFILCDGLVYRIWTYVYVISTVERMIAVNNFAPQDTAWTFGQVFAMANSFIMFLMFCYEYWD